MDHVLHSMRLGTGGLDNAPPSSDVLARFLVTKSSWRGRYRRVLCITPSAVLTQVLHTPAQASLFRYPVLGATWQQCFAK